jgi:hypothetical protein
VLVTDSGSSTATDATYVEAAAIHAIRCLITPPAFRRSVVGVVHAGATVRVIYETALGTGAIHLSRESKAVLASTDWGQLARRRQLILSAGLLIFVMGISYVGYYIGRHRWFAEYGLGFGATLAALALVLMPLLSAVVVGHFALPICARGRRRPAIWLAVVAAGCGLVAATSVAGQPSADDAARALEAGDAPRAYLTAVAVHDLGLGPAAVAATIADDAHLQLVRKAPSVAALSTLVQGRWYGPPNQSEAREILRDRAEREGRAAFEQRGIATIDSIAAATKGAAPDTSTLLSALAASLRADACLTGRDYRCAAQQARQAEGLAPSVPEITAILARTKSTLAANHRNALDTVRKAKRLQDRRTALTGALEATKHYELLSGPAPGSASQDLTQQLAKVNSEIARTEQRERDLEEARDMRRMQSRLMAPLRCRDGSLSPSCRCGGLTCPPFPRSQNVSSGRPPRLAAGGLEGAGGAWKHTSRAAYSSGARFPSELCGRIWL